MVDVGLISNNGDECSIENDNVDEDELDEANI